jgi:RTX calcium-binding nonapeptide repeat (4 copies)
MRLAIALVIIHLTTLPAWAQSPPQARGFECGGKRVTISGTSGDDALTGTDGDDVISGLGGDDVIHAGGGDDVVCGGDGADTLWLEAGQDFAYGGDGGDTIHGGADRDILHGEKGPDTIYGEGDGDHLYGDEGKDVVYGGCKPAASGPGAVNVAVCDPAFDGDDTIYGGEAADELFGGRGDDRLWAGSGPDRIAGEDGKDVLSCGGDAEDFADGGPGKDDFAHDDDCASDVDIFSYTIAKDPLGPDQEFTVTDDRTFIVAGCVPQDGKPHITLKPGSFWVACNDLSFAKDKVQQSKFVSCLDLYPNGVLRGFYISEVRNRRWESVEFSCRDLQGDGTLGPDGTKSGKLVDFAKEGTPYETLIPMDQLPVGIFELQNQQFVAHENMLKVAIPHASAAAILEAGEDNRQLGNVHFSPWVPEAHPHLLQAVQWKCPPGMVLTGAAFGHIPKGDDKQTRPVFLLGECRRLFKRN